MAGCRVFNGSSYYTESANGTDYQSLGALTINAWVYRNAAAQATPIWSVRNGSTASVGFYWWTDNAIYLDIRNGSTKYRAYTSTATGWHMVTGVFNGSEVDADRMKIAFDGTFQTTSGTTSNPTSTSGSLAVLPTVGREDHAGTAISSGHCICYVSIYNVALTEREIAELYINPVSAQRGRLHCWPMNGNETTATHSECDLQRIHTLTGVSMASTSASMLSPPITLGDSSIWHS